MIVRVLNSKKFIIYYKFSQADLFPVSNYLGCLGRVAVDYFTRMKELSENECEELLDVFDSNKVLFSKEVLAHEIFQNVTFSLLNDGLKSYLIQYEMEDYLKLHVNDENRFILFKIYQKVYRNPEYAPFLQIVKLCEYYKRKNIEIKSRDDHEFFSKVNNDIQECLQIFKSNEENLMKLSKNDKNNDLLFEFIDSTTSVVLDMQKNFYPVLSDDLKLMSITTLISLQAFTAILISPLISSLLENLLCVGKVRK
jgi:hypothetical protein